MIIEYYISMKTERILYPCYFDATLTRRQGRRVPVSSAAKNLSPEGLEGALKKSGVTYRLEEKPHPSRWSEREGRAVVAWDGSKEDLLKQVARHLVVHR